MEQAVTKKFPDPDEGEFDPESFSEVDTVDFDSPSSMVGRKLDGRFYIEKNLTDSGADKGGIGVVYLAKDTKLMGRDVVVKILNETALRHPDIVRKFAHEKEALIRIDHPGIVRIVDSGTLSDGNPFMVMDYIQGHSLRKALQLSGRLPLEVAANILESATDALTAAHTAKVLHRDIKPENMMLTPIDDGMYRVRLIDFGIARVEESKVAPETEISRAIGSAMYIAPEQLIGRLDLTPAADIFSMAIVVYEMLTGEVPFKPKAFAEMYQLEKDGVKVMPSELRPDMPREAERILLQALAFEPEERPQNARAWGRYLAHELKIDGRESDRFYASIKTEFHTSPTVIVPQASVMEIQTVQVAKPVPTPDKILRHVRWVLPVVFLAALGAVAAAFFAMNAINRENPPVSPATTVEAAAGQEHQFSYYLMVQKVKNGKDFEEPYRSSGQETVETGYKVRMNFIPDADGYMYILNEGKNDVNETVFSLLFPTTIRNNGLSKITSGQTIDAPAKVKGKRGTEFFWVIWTKVQNPDVEAAIMSAFQTEGKVVGESRKNLETYLSKFQADKVIAVKDTPNQQTLLKTRGDEMLYRFELEHR